METPHYQPHHLPELSAAFDRFVMLRDEMDRLFGWSFTSIARSPGFFQR
jgi:hypothetical protein